MKALLILLASAITLPTVAQEQKPAVPAKEQKTKIAAFEAKKGAVIIRGSSEIGRVRDTNGIRHLDGSVFYRTLVSVESREFTDASSGKKEYGVLLKIKETDSSYLDYDEIDSLLKGIDYIAKIEKGITKLESFQADYKTRDDFTVSTFNDNSGTIRAAVDIGRYSKTPAVILTLDQLAQLRNLVQQAKEKLDSVRQ